MRYKCFLVTLLLLGSQVNVACVLDNDKVSSYTCKGESAIDLGKIPENATSIEISGIIVNHITRSVLSSFAGNLIKLGFLHCNITVIDDNEFDGFFKLERLKLDGNRLTELRATWFKDTISLKSLFVRRNQIANVDDNVFRNLTKLRKLNLDHNNLIEVKAKWFRNTVS